MPRLTRADAVFQTGAPPDIYLRNFRQSLEIQATQMQQRCYRMTRADMKTATANTALPLQSCARQR